MPPRVKKNCPLHISLFVYVCCCWLQEVWLEKRKVLVCQGELCFAHHSAFLPHLQETATLRAEGFHTLDYSSAPCLTVIAFCVPKLRVFFLILYFCPVFIEVFNELSFLGNTHWHENVLWSQTSVSSYNGKKISVDLFVTLRLAHPLVRIFVASNLNVYYGKFLLFLNRGVNKLAIS